MQQNLEQLRKHATVPEPVPVGIRAMVRVPRMFDPGSLYEALASQCKDVEEIGGGFVVATLLPDVLEPGKVVRPGLYVVPEELGPRTNESLRFAVHCAEYGSAFSAEASVVCSLSGKPIRQYRTDSGHPRGGIGARFCVPLAAIYRPLFPQNPYPFSPT